MLLDQKPPRSPYLINPKRRLKLDRLETDPPKDSPAKEALQQHLADLRAQIAETQEILYADRRFALLCVFQAMDAAGKDSAIREVFSGVNPAGCQVTSFKQPSSLELAHDFLWRTHQAVPPRGHIGIFNRSHYEEVLVVRVHPEYLGAQGVTEVDKKFWQRRFAAIRAHEEHLADSGVAVLKFFLHLSKKKQAQRLLRRLDRPDKRWKFSAKDVREREHWSAYMQAYAEMLPETSRSHAPWYAIPADSKSYARVAIAEIVLARLQALGLRPPQDPEDDLQTLADCRRQLKHDVESA